MPIVTISRGTLSGGEELAHCLSTKLGYPTVGLEVIKDAAALYGISESAISEQLKQRPGIIDRLFGEKRHLYLTAVQCALLERAVKGDFIYHGLAGHFLLQGVPNVFKVRLVAPLGYRVKNVMAKKNFTEEAAIKYIERVDEKRKEWTKFLYNVDWTDPALYDIVINLESVTLETACAMVTHALGQPEFRDTPGKQRAVENCALACQVKTKLAFDERTRGIELKVEANEGNIYIQGKLYTTVGMFATGIGHSEDEIRQTAKNIPGVKDVQVELQEVTVTVE